METERRSSMNFCSLSVIRLDLSTCNGVFDLVFFYRPIKFTCKMFRQVLNLLRYNDVVT